MKTSCSLELLHSALAGDLPADSETLLAEHLETCQACAARLDELAGGDELCREAATLLATDELDASVPIGEGWSEIDFVVEHLEPADEPGVLGRLGGYDVLEVIGRGGMGVVLKGFDRSLKRCVAIKVLAPHLAQSSLARQRFAREAQAAAAVVHPHVLAIHQVQPQGRLPFLVMPLVAGQSLSERLAAQGTLELREILRIAMQAAAGLGAAHEQGLVHRDVKPANILLETGVERAVITDFGLARAADDVTLTRQGIIAGTPEYMSPEQARGEPLDGRSDLFSLGSVIYEMASGVSPFRADSTVATIRRLVDEAPRALGSRNPELPPWFTSIVDRLLAKNPADRFASAKELSQLLEGCLAHVQQPANVPLPPGLPRSSRRFSFRRLAPRRPSKRVITGVLVMITAFAATMLGLALLSSDIPDISGRWSGDDWGDVVLTKTSGGQYTGTYSETLGKQPGELEVKWSKVERRFNGNWREGQDRFGQISLRLAGDELRGAFTTDTKSKVNPGTPALADLLWTRGDRSTDELAQSGLQPAAPRESPDWGPSQAPLPGPFQSPDWTATDATARRGAAWLAAAPTPELTIPLDKAVKKVVYSPDGKLLAVAEWGLANVYHAQSGELKTKLALPEDRPSRLAGQSNTFCGPELAFSPDSRLVAVGQGGRWITLFDAHSGQQVLRIEHRGATEIAFSSDGSLLATGGAPKFEVTGTDGKSSEVASDGTLMLWDAKTGELKFNLSGKDGCHIHAIAFSPDGQLLVSAGERGWGNASGDGDELTAAVVEFWSPRAGKRIKHKSYGEAKLNELAFSPDGSRLAVGFAPTGDRIYVEVFSPPTDFTQPIPIQSNGMPGPLAFSPDGRLVGYFDSPELLFWADAFTGKLVRGIQLPARSKGDGWECFALAPAGDRVAISGLDDGKQAVRIWNLAGSAATTGLAPAGTGQAQAEGGEFGGVIPGGMGGMGGGIGGGMGFGGPVVPAGSLKPHHPASPTPPPAFKISTGKPAKAVAYSSDGKWLAIAGDGGMARLYDAASGKLAMQLELLSEKEKAQLKRGGTQPATFLETLWVTALAFSPDSKWLAVGTGTGQLKLFETATGKFSWTFVDSRGWMGMGGDLPLERAHSFVRGIAFSPDGSELASRSDGEMVAKGNGGMARRGTLKLWDAKTGVLKHDLKAEHGGDVSDIAFSRDGARLASAGSWVAGDSAVSTGVEFWDPKTGKRVKTFQLPREGSPQGGLPSAVSLAFAPGIFDEADPFSEEAGPLAIGMAGASGLLIRLDSRKPAEPAAQSALTKAFTEQKVVTYDQILVVDPVTDEIEQRFNGWLGYHMAYSPDGKFLAVYEKPRQFALLDATTGEPQHVIELPEELADLTWSDFAFAPDSQRVAIITAADGKPGVWVWDVASMPAAAEAEAAAEQPTQSPADAAAADEDRAVVALVFATQDKALGAVDNRLDLTLARPRYVLLGLAQFFDLTTKATSELPELGFYFVSPELATDSQARITWAFYERDPVDEDLFLQLKGEAGGRVAFDNSYRVGGKKPGKTILGPVGSDPAATRWRAIQPTGPAFQIAAGQASLTRPVWQTLKIFDALNVNSAVIGSIQLKLRACPILPGAQIVGAAATLKIGDWRHDEYLAKLIGPTGAEATTEPENASPVEAAAATPRTVPQIHPDAPPTSLAFSPDDKLLAVGGARDTVGLYNATTGEPISTIKFLSAEEEAILASIVESGLPPAPRIRVIGVGAGVFSPDSSLLAVANSIGQVKLFDVQSGQLVRALDGVDRKPKGDKPLNKFLELPLAQGSVRGIAFSPDGTLLATCGFSIDYVLDGQDRMMFGNTAGLLKLWDVKTGELKQDLAGGHSQVNGVAFTADGRLLASLGQWQSTGGGRFGVKFWDPQTAKVVHVVGIPNGDTQSFSPWSFGLSPNGKHVAIGASCYDRVSAVTSGAIQLRSIDSGLVEQRWQASETVGKVAFSFDGKSLAALNGESVLTLWDPSTGQPQHIAVAGLREGILTVWDAPDGFGRGDGKNQMAPLFPLTGAELNTFTLSSKSNRAALGGVDAQGAGVVSLWDFSVAPAAAGAGDQPEADESAKASADTLDPNEIVAQVTASTPHSPGLETCRLDIALTRPRQVLIGAVEFVNERTKMTNHLKLLDFFFASSPGKEPTAQAQITWTVEQDDPANGGDWSIAIVGEGLKPAPSFQQSFALSGKSERGGLLGQILTEPETTTWKAVAPQGSIGLNVQRQGGSQEAWPKLRMLEAHGVDGKLLGYVQLRLLACGLLPSAHPKWHEPRLENQVFWRAEELPELVDLSEEPAGSILPDKPVLRMEIDGPVDLVAASPDGKMLAVVSGGRDFDLVKLFDVQSGRQTAVIEPLGEEEKSLLVSPEEPSVVAKEGVRITGLAFSPDCALLAAANNVGQVKLFEVASGKMKLALDDPEQKTPDLKLPAELLKLRLAHAQAKAIAFSPDGSLLATCGSSAFKDPQKSWPPRPPKSSPAPVKLWDVQTGELKLDPREQFNGPTLGFEGEVFDVAFSPDGKLLASGQRTDGKESEKAGIAEVRLWDCQTMKVTRTVQVPNDCVGHGGPTSLGFSPDGKHLVIGLQDCETNKGGFVRCDSLIQVVDPATAAVELAWHAGGPVAFSPDGKLIAGLGDSVLELWNAATGVPEGRVVCPSKSDIRYWRSFAFVPGTNRVAIGGMVGGGEGLTVWDLAAGSDAEAGQASEEPAPVFPVMPVLDIRPKTPVTVVAYSPDGKTLAVGGGGAVGLYDSRTGALVRPLELLDKKEKARQADPDTVRVWPSPPSVLAFSGDGRRLAVGYFGQVKLFDTASGALRLALDAVDRKAVGERYKWQPTAHGWVRGIAFSPDGSLLATCGSAIEYDTDGYDRLGRGSTVGLLKLWDAKTGELKHQPAEEYRGELMDVAFSRDGKWLAAAGGWDGLHVDANGKTEFDAGEGAKLWDPRTARVVKALPVPEAHLNGSSATSLDFSPDGKHLAIGMVDWNPGDSGSGVINVFSTASGEVERHWLVPRAAWQVAFSPSGKSIAALSGQRRLSLWDASSGTLQGHVEPTPPDPTLEEKWQFFAFDPHSRRLAVGGYDGDRHGLVKVWDLAAAPAAGGAASPQKAGR